MSADLWGTYTVSKGDDSNTVEYVGNNGASKLWSYDRRWREETRQEGGQEFVWNYGDGMRLKRQLSVSPSGEMEEKHYSYDRDGKLKRIRVGDELQEVKQKEDYDLDAERVESFESNGVVHTVFRKGNLVLKRARDGVTLYEVLELDSYGRPLQVAHEEAKETLVYLEDAILRKIHYDNGVENEITMSYDGRIID